MKGRPIADRLRAHAGHLEDPKKRKLFLEIADEIDREHQMRMWQCEHEVRRRLCRDIRWAVNLFENGYDGRRSIRRRLDEGDADEDVSREAGGEHP